MKQFLELYWEDIAAPEGSRVLALEDSASDAVFDALSSTTTRRILSLLYEEPRAASVLADETDTSVQNVRYHLDKLAAADLVDIAATQYSEKGNEMAVYAPTDAALVLCAGDSTFTDRLRETVGRWFGVVAILGVVSLLIQYSVSAFESQPSPRSATTLAVEAVGPASAPDPVFSPLLFITEPGVIFFVGALLALVIANYGSARRKPRPSGRG